MTDAGPHISETISVERSDGLSAGSFSDGQVDAILRPLGADVAAETVLVGGASGLAVVERGFDGRDGRRAVRYTFVRVTHIDGVVDLDRGAVDFVGDVGWLFVDEAVCRLVVAQVFSRLRVPFWVVVPGRDGRFPWQKGVAADP